MKKIIIPILVLLLLTGYTPYVEVNDLVIVDMLGLEKVDNDYILTPGRYVGIEDVEDDGEPFEEKMERLTKTLSEQFARSRELEEEIRKQLGGIGYEL